MGRSVTLSSEEIRLLLDASFQMKAGKRYRALVLEAVSGQLDHLMGPLSGQSFEVDICSDLSAALNQCRKFTYDLVIVGCRGRGLDGVSFLSRVRNLCPRAFRFLVSDGCDWQVLVHAVNLAGIHAILDQSWSDVRIRQLLSRNFDKE